MQKKVFVALILVFLLFSYSCKKKHKHNYINGKCQCGEVLLVEEKEEYTEGLIFQLSSDGTYYGVVGINGSGYKDGIFVSPVDVENLEEVIIPNYYNGLPVKSIEYSAFGMCFNLKKVIVPDNVVSIAPNAFEHVNSIEYNIFDNLKYLGNNENPYHILMGTVDNNLNTYNIHEKTKAIASYAFSKCRNLDTIYISKNIDYMDSCAFISCPKLKVFCEAECEKEQWKKPINGSKSWNNDNAPVYYNVNKESIIELDNGLYLIDNDCATLVRFNDKYQDVIIEDKIKYNKKSYNLVKIGDKAFYGCRNLKSISIPNSVENIGESSFNSCSRLVNIELSQNIKIIEKNCFSGCDALKEIIIPEGVIEIKNGAFSSCRNLENITLPSSLIKLGESIFVHCSSLEKLYIPRNVQEIGEFAFSGSSLTQIEVDNSNQKFLTMDNVLYINDNNNLTLFTYLCNLDAESFVVPTGVVKIGNNAFSYNENLKTIILSDTVNIIGDSAFYGCTSLTNIEIPNSVTSIGDFAFRNCTSLTNIEMPNSVTSIGNHAFYLCTGLTSIEIPNSVTSIGDGAFSNCSNLISIEIPNSVTSIGDSAFRNCTSLTSIEIPNSVTSIGSYAFEDCTSLTIYCEVKSKPDGWDSDWNYSNRPVEWGYIK